MSKRKESTDFDIVSQQFLSFRNLEDHIGIINTVNTYHCRQNEIGDTTDHVKYSTYKQIFNTLQRKEEYTILLVDDSMLTLHYVFNQDRSLKGQTLSFFPNYRNNTSSGDIENSEDADVDDKRTFEKLSNYIRIDYTEVGRQEYIHTLVHLHVGVFKESIRFPLQHFLYPYEFLFLIFKYLYNRPDDELQILECNTAKESKLTEAERKKMRLVFGEIEG